MKQGLINAMFKGLNSQNWQIIGQSGSWAKALQPLENYIQKRVLKAVNVEREACARLCDELVNQANNKDYQIAADWCAVRIRARKKS